MAILLLLLIIICALPIAGVTAIILLAVSRKNYMRKAALLEMQMTRLYKEGRITLEEWNSFNLQPSPGTPTVKPAAPPVHVSPTLPVDSPVTMPVSPKTQPTAVKPEPASRPEPTFRQGLIPLVIGVIFVILAGFIFATTTWRILPDLVKALLVLLMSGLFFGASAIAEYRLSIEKTSKAFYLLGSIFLFVTVLAFGYFGLLGENLTLFGSQYAFLLFLGTLFTEIALFLGLRRFGDRLYAGLCFYGITITTALFLYSFHPTAEVFTFGMAAFAILLLLSPRIPFLHNAHAKEPLWAEFKSYCRINLWIVSALVLVYAGSGVLAGLTTMMMAGIHLYQSREEEHGSTEVYVISLFFLVGVLRGISPGSYQEWMYGIASTCVFLSFLNTFGFEEDNRKQAGMVITMILMGLTLITITIPPLFMTEITFSNIVCLALLLADITMLAWNKKKAWLNAIHSVVVVVFLYELLTYATLFSYLSYSSLAFVFTVALGILYEASAKKLHPFHSRWGEVLHSILIFLNTMYFIMLTFEPGWTNHLYCAGSVLILAAVIWFWGTNYPWMKPAFPFALLLLVFPVGILLATVLLVDVEFPWMLFGYLILFAGFDLWKRRSQRDYMIPIIAIGLTSCVYFFWIYRWNLPFLIVLGVYLFLKTTAMEEGKERIFYLYSAYSFILAGLFLLSYHWLDHFVLRMFVPAACLVFTYFAVTRFFFRTDEGICGRLRTYTTIIGSLFYGMILIGFYRNDQLSFWCLVPSLLLFVFTYVLSYNGKLTLCHLLTSLITLGLPAVLYGRYVAVGLLTEHHFYIGVMAAALVTMLASKWYVPMVYTEEEGIRRIDWYHILLVLVILPMALWGTPVWRFAYTGLLMVYSGQYCMIKPIRNAAWTVIGLLGCIAFWIQPLIDLPSGFWWEIQVSAMALFIWSLPFIWGKTKQVSDLQTLLYSLCLGVLGAHAWFTQSLVNVFLLEGVCLTIFILSFLRKCGRWVRISGAMIIALTLYMTKGFWLSISWWVYLLIVGIGLIGFGAFNEWKKKL